jgi:hypothetical protein
MINVKLILKGFGVMLMELIEQMKIYKSRINVFANISGEWWIIDGNANFADGDIGDLNHEAYVIQFASEKILSELGIDLSRIDDVGSLNNHEDLIIEILANDSDFVKKYLSDDLGEEIEDLHAVKEVLNYDPAKAIINYLKEKSKLTDIDDLVMIGYGSSSIDVRLFSMKNWGWKRVANSAIETWTFSEKDFNDIKSGLYEIINDEDISDKTCWLEIRSRKFAVDNFPIEILADGNYRQAISFIKEANSKTKVIKIS